MQRLVLFTPFVLASCACPPVEDDDDDTPPADVVSLGGITLRQAAAGYSVSALFREPTLAAGCATDEVAGCTLLTCDGAADPVAASTLDAGAITVATESAATENVSAALTLDGDGQYGSVNVSDAVFFANADELVATAAGGADIGALAFELVAPTRIQLTAPPLPSVNVRVTNPIDIAWSNSSAGALTATLTDAALTRVATCSAVASSAALSIPAAVVGRFPIGGGQLGIEVATTTTASIDATHSAFFSAVSSVTSPTGGAGQYNVFFESP